MLKDLVQVKTKRKNLIEPNMGEKPKPNPIEIPLEKIVRKLWRQRSFRFLFVGVLLTLLNILLIVVLVDIFNLNTPLLRSLGNACVTEICLLISFFCYRQFVWQVEKLRWQEIYLRELPKYHVSVASVISLRVLILFPLLDWLGMHPALNTMIGIALGAVSSYALSDKFVFNVRK